MRFADAKLERLPALSAGLAACWLLAFFVVEVGFARGLERARQEVRSTVAYFVEHPTLHIPPRLGPVLRDLMPGYEGSEVFSFLHGRAAAALTAQRELDTRTARTFAALDAHPHRRLGVVPRAPSVHGLLTHALIQPGWLQLLVALALLLAAGPLLERVWGARLLGALCLASAPLGAGVYCLVDPTADRPLVGAGALLAALCAAVVVRFGRREVDFLGWLPGRLELHAEAPGWSLAVVGPAAIAASTWMQGAGLPASIELASAPVAWGAGAAFGAFAAWAILRTGLEARLGPEPPPPVRRRVSPLPRFDLARVQRARDAGDLDTAFALLLGETRRSARNRDAVLALWELAIELGEPKRAVPAMLQLIREELRRGAAAAGASHWSQLLEHAPKVLLDPTTLVRLVPAIREQGGDAQVAVALRQAVDPANRAMGGPLALEIASLAAKIAPDVAECALEKARAASDLAPAQREMLLALTGDAPPAPASPDPGSRTAPRELPVDPFFAEQDRSAFGDMEELGELAAPDTGVSTADGPGGPQVLQAVPTVLGDEGLAMRFEGGGQARLGYRRIRAVTLAGVRGLSSKPVLLVDLLLEGPELAIVRFRSDHFDPRSLFPSVGPLEAVCRFAAEVTNRAEAQYLGSGAADGGIEVFDSLEDYAERLLAA